MGGPKINAQDIVWSAAPTPFLADGSLDHAGLERLIQQHRRQGVSGLFLCGTCGEGPFMPNAQRAELVRKIRKIGGCDFHLSVQVSDTSAPRVRENIAQAVDAGADSVVIAAPWLRPFVNRQFARRYFLEVLDRPCPVAVGIYVLLQPPETGIDLSFWTEIASHPNASYLKDSSASEDYGRAFSDLKARRPGLVLRTGYEFDVLSALRKGYDGCLLGTAVLNGRMIAQAARALQACDAKTALAWQDRSNRLLHDLFRPDVSGWMAGLKYTLRKMGIFSTEFAHLVYPITDDDRRRIDAAIEREKEYL